MNFEMIPFPLKYNYLISYIRKIYYQKKCSNLEQLIFVATTGRSGTMTLCKIFKKIEGCAAFHEAFPAMKGECMMRRNQGDSRLAKYIYDTVKSVKIRQYAAGKRYYMDSNHMFIKSFIDFVINDFGEKVKVIHLYRDPVKVASSMVSLNTIPGTPIGNEWYLDYHAPENFIKIPDILDNDEVFSSDWFRSLWYWYEIEARVAFWRKKLKKVQFVDIATEELNNPKNICDLLDKLHIDYNRSSMSSIQTPVANRQTDNKIKKYHITDDDYRKHELFQSFLKDRGYTVPQSAKRYNI